VTSWLAVKALAMPTNMPLRNCLSGRKELKNGGLPAAGESHARDRLDPVRWFHNAGERTGGVADGRCRKENVKTGQQETKEPSWKPPADSNHQRNKGHPPPRPRRAEDNETA
jgi:hypothetical protein